MLSRDLARYIDQKRSLGFKFSCQNVVLRSFVTFAEECGDRYIRNARVLAWAAQASSPEHRRTRLLTVRRFALALHAENARHEVSAADALGHAKGKRRPPYIYSPDEIVRLLRAAAELEPAGSIRPVMYATLLGLVAATGLRIGEALALLLREHLPKERRASQHTCEAYAQSFQLLLGFAASRLKSKPSKIDIERLDAPLILASCRIWRRSAGTHPGRAMPGSRRSTRSSASSSTGCRPASTRHVGSTRSR